jgi:fluoride exporter
LILLGVALAGALGAPARYLVERAVSTRHRRLFPWGTFVVNVGGSLALGLLAGLVLAQGWSKDAQTVLGTGFLGAYTTFSTFAYETVRRAEEGAPRVAVAYALGSVATGVAAAALGLALAGAW